VTAAPPGEALTYNVTGLLSDAVGASRTYAIAGVMLDLGPDLAQCDQVEGSIRMARTNRGILVTGRLSTALAETCSRCLREIEVPIAIAIEDEALPSIDLANGLPVDVSLEPDAVRLTDHHELELEPLVREAIQLGEPIAPLCRPDCPGLCIVCGGELSEGIHDHDGGEIDPRLEALGRFRVDGDAETG
jgi:uncharacterized protein